MRNLDAYYYGFTPTGHDEVDAVLEAVASAGSAYHSTKYWNERSHDGTTAVGLIQRAAKESAAQIQIIIAERDQLKAENEALRGDAERFRHLMFNHVDWARNGKDDDAVMLEFGPYPSHKLRESIDAERSKEAGHEPV